MESQRCCPLCKNNSITKRGKQKTRDSEKQVFYCKECKKRFVFSQLKKKSYSPKIILKAVSYYNLGNTLEQTTKTINKKFKVKASKSAVHKWIKEFKSICSYSSTRKAALKEHEKNPIKSKLFTHKSLTYKYSLHKPKIEALPTEHTKLKEFLFGLQKKFPHSFFEQDNRCSQTRIQIQPAYNTKNNQACELAKLALKTTTNNKERHGTIEEFFLTNDSSTIATEVPIWFWERNLANGTGICGHIDILQIREQKAFILDYKPEATKQNKQNVTSQLYLYALGLSFRTGTPLNKIRCAWFDEENYFEFEPAKTKANWQATKKV